MYNIFYRNIISIYAKYNSIIKYGLAKTANNPNKSYIYINSNRYPYLISLLNKYNEYVILSKKYTNDIKYVDVNLQKNTLDFEKNPSLLNANFDNCKFDDCEFLRWDLRYGKFTNCSFKFTYWNGTKIDAVDNRFIPHNYGIKFYSPEFINCDMQNAQFQDIMIDGFDGCTQFNNCDLENTILHFKEFSTSNLRFNRSNLKNVDMSNSSFNCNNKIIFSDCNMDGMKFNNVTINGNKVYPVIKLIQLLKCKLEIELKPSLKTRLIERLTRKR